MEKLTQMASKRQQLNAAKPPHRAPRSLPLAKGAVDKNPRQARDANLMLQLLRGDMGWLTRGKKCGHDFRWVARRWPLLVFKHTYLLRFAQ